MSPAALEVGHPGLMKRSTTGSPGATRRMPLCESTFLAPHRQTMPLSSDSIRVNLWNLRTNHGLVEHLQSGGSVHRFHRSAQISEAWLRQSQIEMRGVAVSELAARRVASDSLPVERTPRSVPPGPRGPGYGKFPLARRPRGEKTGLVSGGGASSDSLILRYVKRRFIRPDWITMCPTILGRHVRKSSNSLDCRMLSDSE